MDVSSSSDESSSDEDDNQMIVENELGAIVPINNNNNNNSMTLAEKIQLNNKNFYTDSYPLSLKNLCRIRIKNCLINYNERTVDSLEMLPFSTKKFLLFEENIIDVLKLAKCF